jgi:hypothetical protein
MSPRQYLPHLLNGLLIAGMLLGGLVLYPSLPERFPGHLTLLGIPDHYQAKSMTSWFLLVLPGMTAMAGLYLVAAAISLLPQQAGLIPVLSGGGTQSAHSLSFPEPPELRMRLRAVCYGLAVAVGLVTVTWQMMIFVTAQGGGGLPFMLANTLWCLGFLLYILPQHGLAKEVRRA